VKKKALFLDRDGVINQRFPSEYIQFKENFIWIEGVRQAFVVLSQKFDYLFVITNQQGIGKGIMTEEQLHEVHQYMLETCKVWGVTINGIYYCPHRKEANCRCRKPKTGLIEQAMQAFSDIDLQESWLVGDSISDIQLGNSLNIKTALIPDKEEEKERYKTVKTDLIVKDLFDFSERIKAM